MNFEFAIPWFLAGSFFIVFFFLLLLLVFQPEERRYSLSVFALLFLLFELLLVVPILIQPLSGDTLWVFRLELFFLSATVLSAFRISLQRRRMHSGWLTRMTALFFLSLPLFLPVNSIYFLLEWMPASILFLFNGWSLAGVHRKKPGKFDAYWRDIFFLAIATAWLVLSTSRAINRSSLYQVGYLPVYDIFFQFASVFFLSGWLVYFAQYIKKFTFKASSLASHLHREINRRSRLQEKQREFQRELELARAVQERFLPKNILRLKGMTIVSSYTPLEEVGGDIYDLIEYEDGSISLFLGDARGHGLAPALLSAMAKFAFANLASDERECSTALGLINQEMHRVLTPGDFLTAFYLLMKKGKNMMEYACAGQVPPMLYSKSTGQVSRLEASGTLLGMRQEATFETRSVVLQPGDRLILFTDGLVEEKNLKGEMFGDERLEEAVRRNSERDIVEYSQALLVALDLFKGGAASHDDLTLVVIEITGVFGDGRSDVNLL